MNYNTDKRFRARWILIFLLVAAVVAGIGYLIGTAANAEDTPVRCWIMCKPVEGNYVNVHRTPGKNSQSVGYLECGDDFLTDGKSSNGFIRVYNIGEYGEGWVYCGYVCTEEPVMVNEQYVVVAKTRVACRQWMDGPQIKSRPWLVNGSNVWVYCKADGWMLTSHGYILEEWLEANPL